MAGESDFAPKRLDAIRLAKGSKWEELRRLVDAEPSAAQQVDSYGMLPLHWACTEPHSISESVLMALLKAHPQGARAMNTAEMVPLQIAIKAQAKIEWLQALLASYPDAVLKKVPSGENAVQLARKAKLPARSVRLLEEMYQHVCEKAGYTTMVGSDDEMMVSTQQQQPSNASGYESGGGASEGGQWKASVAGGIRPIDPMGSESVLQRFGVDPNANVRSNHRGNPNLRRVNTNSDVVKARTMSDTDFQNAEAFRTTMGASMAAVAANGTPIEKPLPYQTSTRLSSRTVVSLPPRWMNAPNCHICSLKFGNWALKKRHHCRNCGQSICRDHSARERMRLPHYGLTDRYRVCVVCHDLLRNANRQMMQPSASTVRTTTSSIATPMQGRKSDEAPQRLLSQSGGGAPSYPLERHVSAPARAGAPEAAAPYSAIHEQVASLQKQVSQLMEEKEQAESQLRVQAELLGEALDPERYSGVGRRDRLNSVPLKLSISSNGSGHAGPSVSESPNPNSAYTAGQMYSPFDGNQRVVARTNSCHSFRGERMTAGAPSYSSEPVGNGSMAVGHVQEAFSNMSFVGSEPDNRQTFTDLHDEAASYPATEDSLAHTADDIKYDAMVEDDIDDDDEDDEELLPEIDVLVNLGLSLMNKGSANAAVQAFARALEISPENATLYTYLGKAYYADENLDDAVLAIEMALKYEPTAATSTLLGKLLFEKGDHERAIEAYQLSLDMQRTSDE